MSKFGFLLFGMVGALWTMVMGIGNTAPLTPAALYPKGQLIAFWYVKKVELNSASEDVETPRGERTSIELVESVRKSLLGIKANFMREDGGAVNYAKVKASLEFREYLKLVAQLRGVSLETLNPKEKKAAYINLYNSLTFHSILNGLLDVKGGTLARLKLYASASYNIGGKLFSLNDLENGLLRGNRLSAVPLTFKPFRKSSDPRRLLMLDCDARIHFALNCGAMGCPPIGVYSPVDIDEQLNVATQGFLDNSVAFDVATKTVTLSMLHNWYRQDFGSTDDEVLSWIKDRSSPQLRSKFDAFQAGIAGGQKPKIAYAAYDWSLNDL